jgi:hypothetical protein
MKVRRAARPDPPQSGYDAFMAPHRLCAAACSLACVLHVADALAADRHVGSGQTYATVQEAVAAAQAGDTVLVHGGSYAEDVTLAASGMETARITLAPAGDGTATVTGQITIDGSYWDIVDLTFVGRAGADAFRVRGDHNRIVGIELSGGDRDGIDGGGQGNEVRDAHIHHFDAGESDAHCIVLNPGAEDWVISGNRLHDCSGDTLQLFAQTAERTILNTRVEHNEMYYDPNSGVARTENAIDVKNADGLIIVGNRMYGFPDNKVVVFQKAPINIDMSCNVMHTGFTGVEFRGEDGGVVENVTFTRNLMHGYGSYALKFDGTLNANVYNNTFVTIGSDGLRIEGAGLEGGNVQNNLWVDTGSVDAGNFSADHNGFFNAPTSIGSASDVTGDPLLDAMYQLGDGSPMIDAGIDVGLPLSGAAPDIGWHEVGLRTCSTPPESGTGGGGGSDGEGGDGSGPGASGGAGGANAADPDADGGCGCAIVGRRAPTKGLAALALLVLVATQRRRRRTLTG